MEVIANKDRYQRQESRKQKALRLLRRFIWVLPLLGIALGLGIGWRLIQNIRAESTRLPEVDYGKYVEPSQKPKKEVSRLELYREQMKREKEEKITSRYERIISGSEIVGKLDYGKVIPTETPDGEKQPEASSSLPQADSASPESKETVRKVKLQKENRTAGAQPVTKGKEKEEASSSLPDSLPSEDSLQKPPEAPDPFFTLKTSASGELRYTKAYFHGEQEIINGAYIRLRLGEDLLVGGTLIPRNTVFRGTVCLSQNKIDILVNRIGSLEIAATVCDQDYHPGIVVPAAKRAGMEEAVQHSFYQTGSGTAMDLPYEILQDVTQNILRNKRRKQSILRINDGYPVYITLNTP